MFLLFTKKTNSELGDIKLLKRTKIFYSTELGSIIY